MNILIVTPAPPGSRKGNRVTARRWGQILRQLGHKVAIKQEYRGEHCDLMVALHAWRSFNSVERLRRECPDTPLIVALTGTDLYQDLRENPHTGQALELASLVIVLQPLGIAELPEHLRGKARVLYQSARPPAGASLVQPRQDVFEVCVLGHLRPVKDPFRAAEAARLMPDSSRLRVLQVGAALSQEMAELACAEMRANFRYRWLGERPRWQALRILARCRLLVLTSLLEGGANVISEALAASVPVLSSHIPGSAGVLGDDYPGLFPVGDTQALATLLHRAETEASFYNDLKTHCVQLAQLVAPAREANCWARLLHEITRSDEARES